MLRTNFWHDFHITGRNVHINVCPGTINLWVIAERMHDGAPAHLDRAVRYVTGVTPIMTDG
jgi:hypothetical protein